jgi:hypothetical protein
MSDRKLSDSCNLQLTTQAKITSDYQVDYIMYKNKLIDIQNKITKIDKLISDQNKKIENKKLETQIYYTNTCLPSNTNITCKSACNKMYNPNNRVPQVIGKTFPCQITRNTKNTVSAENIENTRNTKNTENIENPRNTENFNILDTIETSIIKLNTELNTELNKYTENLNILNNCECLVPFYNEIDNLNDELNNLNLQKSELFKQYDLINKQPPKVPVLNLTCCSNKITCVDGNCGSLFDDCKLIKSLESFETNDDNSVFLSNNIVSFILLIILILFIFIQYK